MPKVQVYLPDDLHQALTRLELVPSHLLQDAVRHELARAERRQAALELIAELDARYGHPTEQELVVARDWAAGITAHLEPATIHPPAAAKTKKRPATPARPVR